MKRLFTICILGMAVVASADEAKAPASGPQITFESTKHDFGEVEPQKLVHEFKFKNTGN